MRLTEALAHTHRQSAERLLATAKERIDPEWIRDALSRAQLDGGRRRKLPAESVVWMIIGACLVAAYAFPDVVRYLGLTVRTARSNPQADPTSGALAEARARLGDVVMRELFTITAGHWADQPDFRPLRFHGLQVLVADGSSVRTPDTTTNREEFGKPSSRRGEAAYPVVSFVALMEAATHLVIDVALGGAKASELPLLATMFARLPSDSLLLLDRGYDSVGHLARIVAVGPGRHFLVRGKAGRKVKVLREHSPGDEEVEIRVDPALRRLDPTLPKVFVVRRIRYMAKTTEVVLLTSLRDPGAVSKEELARLYHQRWEIEMALDDIKTEQRDSAVTLRSKTPTGIRQEIYGLLVAHNLVRVEMAHVAVAVGVEPTRISFHRALLVVSEGLRAVTATAPTRWPAWQALMRASLASLVLPERRSERAYARAMKMPVGRYARKLPSRA